MPTITYTIQEQEKKDALTTPFIALVKVDGQPVETYDPRPSAPWMYTLGDLVRAVNAKYKGARYMAPEKFNEFLRDEQAREALFSIARLYKAGDLTDMDVFHLLNGNPLTGEE